jgi:hypothetical protein
MKTKEPKIQFYDSLEDLPLFNWHKMHEKNEVNWLIIGFDGRQKLIKNNELFLIKRKLEDEYFVLWDDDNFKQTLEKRNEINYYIGLYENVKAILDRMWLGFHISQLESRLIYIRQLKALRYIMPEINSLQGDKEELERLYQQNEGVKTKINLLVDDIKVEGTKVTKRLNTELAIVSKILELGYAIDSKSISVADWIDLQKQAQEINFKRITKD